MEVSFNLEGGERREKHVKGTECTGPECKEGWSEHLSSKNSPLLSATHFGPYVLYGTYRLDTAVRDNRSIIMIDICYMGCFFT